jgi:hypothetical protein
VFRICCLFWILLFSVERVFAESQNCRYILRHPSSRHETTLKRKIFFQGDGLLRDFFLKRDKNYPRFSFLSIEQKKEFVFHNKEKILLNLIDNETHLDPIGKSQTYFSVNGGNSRLGRFANSLKKVGVNVFLDFELVDSSAIYMHDYKTVVLGLEEALYPNQLSLNVLHVAQHVSHYERTLLIPVIFDKVSTKSFKGFSLDELLVYEKEISQMMRYEKIKFQNVHLRSQSSKNLRLRPALGIFRELSMRVLLKKYELLKVVNCLKEIEKDPDLLKNEEFLSQLEDLGPEIIIDVHAFELKESYPGSIQKKARGSIDLIEKAISISESTLD